MSTVDKRGWSCDFRGLAAGVRDLERFLTEAGARACGLAPVNSVWSLRQGYLGQYKTEFRVEATDASGGDIWAKMKVRDSGAGAVMGDHA